MWHVKFSLLPSLLLWIYGELYFCTFGKKLARVLSLAFRVGSMACLESMLLSFHPCSMGWLVLASPIPCTGQSPIGNVSTIKQWALLEPVPWSCVTCLHRHRLQVPGAPEENQSWSGECLASLHFLEALAVSLPDRTPLSEVGLIRKLNKDEEDLYHHVLYAGTCLSQILWARTGEWAEPVPYPFSVTQLDT